MNTTDEVPEIAESSPAPDAQAESSPADESVDSSQEEIVSLIRDVVDPKEESPEESHPQESVQEEVETGEDEKVSPPDDENFSDVPFHKHPRFQQLLRKAKTYETDAKQYQQVQNFLDTNGLSAPEAADALIFAGLLKTNPVEAWKRLRPIAENLAIAAGEILPHDLDARVKSGEMSYEVALDISRSKAHVESIQRQTAFDRQRQEMEYERSVLTACYTEADRWLADRTQKDPRFEQKRQAMHKEVLYLQASEGKPTSPDGVRSQLERAYAEVNKMYVAQPTPQQKPAITPVRGGQTVNASAEPMSTLDIIRMHKKP
jgi:hypothetical protein